MGDNEVFLKRILRVFRNGMVAHIRASMRHAFGEAAEVELASIFGKRDGSEETQWERMIANAERARAFPEVSTQVLDKFELLGVSDFHAVLEKFFHELLPSRDGSASEQLPERKKGLLRCLQQIKVFRDPNAHDVSEPIGSDSLQLCLLNCKVVCTDLAIGAAYAQLEQISQELNATVSGRSAVLVSVAGTSSNAMKLARECLQACADVVDVVRVGEISPSELRQCLARGGNCVLVLDSHQSAPELTPQEADDALRVLSECALAGVPLAILYSQFLAKDKVAAAFAEEALALFNLAPKRVLVDDYAEATTAWLRTTLKGRTPVATTPVAGLPGLAIGRPVQVANVVLDDRLAPKIFEMLRQPDLEVVRFVVPFVGDVTHALFGRVVKQMIAAVARGCEVTIITRPPSAEDQDFQVKTRVLSELHRERIAVYLNEKLHSKVYLFKRTAQRVFWAVGSHNLTAYAHGGSLETSMVGYRSPEFDEAMFSYESARRSRDTLSYDTWQIIQRKSIAKQGAHPNG
jgi:hypothetical protein